MAKRQIFVTTAQIVDANGSFATLNGYPKTFDSRNYDNDIDKAQNRFQRNDTRCVRWKNRFDCL